MCKRQMYSPPADHLQLYDALVQFPAPQCGLACVGLSSLSSPALSEIVDQLESDVGDAGQGERYFATNGGGAGFGRKGWAGSADDFALGVCFVVPVHCCWPRVGVLHVVVVAFIAVCGWVRVVQARATSVARRCRG